MDNWDVLLVNVFLVNHRLDMLMNHILVILMNHILVNFLNHVLVMLMDYLLVAVLNDWLVDNSLMNRCLLMGDDSSL